jgi:hypothetical protein
VVSSYQDYGLFTQLDPNSANNSITLHKYLMGAKPDLTNLYVFGCPVNVTVPAQKWQRWEMRSKMSYFVSYDLYSTGYLIWFPGARKTEKA